MRLIGKVVETKYITAKEYLQLTEKDKRNIKDISIVTPKLGSNSFGNFKVELKSPEYKVYK